MPKNFDFVANVGQQAGAGVQNYLNEVGQANLQKHNYAQMQATREQAIKAYSDQYYQATGMDPNDPKSQVEALRVIGPYIPQPTADMKSKDYYGLAMGNEATLMTKIKGAKAQKYKEAKAGGQAPAPASGSPAPAAQAAQPPATGTPQLSAQAGTAPSNETPAPGQVSATQNVLPNQVPASPGEAGLQPEQRMSAQYTRADIADRNQNINAGFNPDTGEPTSKPADPTQMAGTAPAAPASEYERLKGMKDKWGGVEEFDTDFSKAKSDEIGAKLPGLVKEGHTTQSELETALARDYGSDILADPGVKEMVKSLMSSKDFAELKQKGDLEKNKQALERLRLHFDQGKATKEHIGEALKIKHASIAGLSTAKANVKIIEGQINNIAKTGGISRKDKDGNDKLDQLGNKIPPVTDKSQVDAALSDLRNQLGAAHQQVDLYQTQYQEAAKYAADNGVKDSPQEMTYNPEDPMGTGGAQSGNRPSLDSFNR